MRRIRAVSAFPTLFTLGNLVCGFFAIVVAARIAKPGDSIDFVPSPKLDSARELIASVDPTHNVMLCGVLIFTAGCARMETPISVSSSVATSLLANR